MGDAKQAKHVPETGAPEATKPLNAAAVESDEETPNPVAPFVALSRLTTTRYNGCIGQIVSAMTDKQGVERWAVRLASGEEIRVPVDKCTRVTAKEVAQWELDRRRSKQRTNLVADGATPGKVLEWEKEQVDTSPFPVALYSYVLEMDNFFRSRLTTGEEVDIDNFNRLFDSFEADVCKDLVSTIGNQGGAITAASARARLDCHMDRSKRIKAACGRYFRSLGNEDTGTLFGEQSVTDEAFGVASLLAHDARLLNDD